jgi:PAS domain S-box-containing protein
MRTSVRIRVDWPLSVRLIIAAAIFATALALRFLLSSLETGLPYVTFYPAVILCFLLCSNAPGVLFAIVSVATVYYIFIPPYWEFGHNIHGEIASATFLLSTLSLGFLIRNLYQGKQALARLSTKQNIILGREMFGIAEGRGHGIVWANHGLEQLLGYGANELAGVSARRFFPDNASFQAFGDAAYPVLRSGTTYRGEVGMIRKDGRKIVVDLSGSPIDAKSEDSLWLYEDITARKLAEEKLRTSEYLLARTGEIAGVGGWQHDLASGNLEWSDETSRLHGMIPGHHPETEEAIGFFAPEARPVIREAVREGFENGTPFDLELPVLSAAGRQFWARVVGVAEFEHGAPVRLIGAFQDVTKRRDTERDLITSNELMRVTLASIGDAVITTGIHGEVVYLNPVAELLTGWRNEDAVGQELTRVFTALQADTRQPAPDPVAACLQGGTNVRPDGQTILVSRNGDEYAVEATAAAILDKKQELYGAVLVFRDVSEQRRQTIAIAQRERQYEEALRRLDILFANSIDMLVLARITPDGDFAYEAVNPSWERLMGVPASTALGRSPRDCLSPDAANTIIANWTACIRERRALSFQYNPHGPDLFDVESTCVPVYEEDSETQHLICVARDVTERNKLEASVRQMQRMEAMGQLTAGVAHDFNNLLQTIVSALELLAEQPEIHPEAQEYVTVAEAAAQRGTTLVHRLLAFSSKQPLEPVLLRPDDVIENLRGLLATTLGPRIRVETNVDTGVWPVKADSVQLENCLFNLVINARDAMPNGGVLRFGACNRDAASALAEGLPAGEYVRFVVQDSGTGMAPETLARAVEPFFTTKPIGKGTGLGLSMVHGFARQSGGDVRIDSMPGLGTIMNLWLPRAIDAAANGDPQAGSGRTLSMAPHNLG